MRTNFIEKNVCETHSKSIYDLLVEMYPEHREYLAYHYSGTGKHFNELVGILFDLPSWELRGPIEISPSEVYISERRNQIMKEEYKNHLKGGEDSDFFRFDRTKAKDVNFETLPPITVVQPDDKYRILDGYHRVFLAKKAEKSLTGYVWQKSSNNHPNAEKIRKLSLKS